MSMWDEVPAAEDAGPTMSDSTGGPASFCKGSHDVDGLGGCGTDGCRGQPRCVAACTGCPDRPRSLYPDKDALAAQRVFFSPGKDRSPPDCQLRLEWVYGYCGKRCRNNLYYDSDGDLVYFIAGVGVVLDKATNTQRFYFEHGDDITCLRLHSNKHVVASGEVGKTPTIYVWDSRTLETRSILKDGHTHGIAALSFGGPSERLLVSAGQDPKHTIVVWEWRRGQQLATVTGGGDVIYDIAFDPYQTNVIVSCGTRNVRFWALSGNVLQAKKGQFGKVADMKTQLCVAFGPSGITYTGAETGDIYVWKGVKLAFVIGQAHVGPVHSMFMCRDGYATGGQDGAFRLWSPSFEPIRTIPLRETPVGYRDLAVRTVVWEGEMVACGTANGEVLELNVAPLGDGSYVTAPTVLNQGHPAVGELWGLACHPFRPYFVTASEDKSLCVWNMETKALESRQQLPGEARSAAFSPDGQHIAVGLKGGTFVVCDRTLEPLIKVTRRKHVIHELKYSPDGKILAVGSNDDVVDLYAPQKGYAFVGTCKGPSSYITHIDFDVESARIQINSGAGERLVYGVKSGKQITNSEELSEIKWATWTSVLGDEAAGIWPKYANTDDVNACDTSRGVVATGDDWGQVKLFRFPSTQRGAKFRSYKGHSAHVTNVRFAAHGTRLLSAGGGDRSVFQWWCHHEDEAEDIEGHQSHEEDSDSDDDVDNEVDSDVEREATNTEALVAKRVIEEDKVAIRKLAGPAGTSTKRVPVPDVRLSLTHVHGYRGYDCRNNVSFTATDDIVYHIAAVGIVMERGTKEQRFYTKHTDDILCLAGRPVGEEIATGQITGSGDSAIHVWNSQSMATLSILSTKGTHKRGVCALDFSPDGKKLISIGLDEDHMIISWDWQKGTKLASSRGHRDQIFCIKWRPLVKDAAVTVGVRHIKFWEQAGSGFTAKRGVFGKAGKLDTMLSIEFGANGEVYTGAQNGKVYVWDGNKLVRTVALHTGPVFALFQVRDRFVSGGKDGIVKLWSEAFEKCEKEYPIESEHFVDRAVLKKNLPPIRALAVTEDGEIVIGTTNGELCEISSEGALTLHTQGHGGGELWGLACSATEQVFATASDDHTVRLWDGEAHRQLRMKRLKFEARAVGLSPQGNWVVVGGKNGAVLVCTTADFEEVASFDHRTREISAISFAPNNRFVAVGSHQRIVDIYDIVAKKRVGVCKGASSYITQIDWDSTSKLISVNSGAKEQLFFEAPRGKRVVPGKDVLKVMEWVSMTRVLDDTVTGIWPPHSDVTDVNSCCRASDLISVATGDDFGFVKLFSYPSTGEHAKFKKYAGHSAHVTAVRWLPNDTHLVSVGGQDAAVMLWKYSNSHTQDAGDGASTDAEACGGPRASSTGALPVGGGGESDDSDTDEDEDGYDSDVEREKALDYLEFVDLLDPVRPKAGVRPVQSTGASVQKPSRKVRTNRQVQRLSAANTDAVSVVSAELEWVHGYRGFDCRDNLRYNRDGQIVYHAAALGIVMEPSADKRQQLFYTEHTDDITSLAMVNSSVEKYGNVAATGQIGEDADIHVWDTASLTTLSIIRGFHRTAVVALDFSASGKLLLSVDSSPNRGIAVYKWATGQLMASASKTSHGRIFVAKFKPGSETEFVTCGVKHIKFWKVVGGELQGVRGILGSNQKMPTMLSCAFGPDGTTYSGSIGGEVFMWRDKRLFKVAAASPSGLKFKQVPVFTLHVATGREPCLISGSKDGSVRFWDLDLGMQQRSTVSPRPDREGGAAQKPDAIRSIDSYNGNLLIGTGNSAVYTVRERQQWTLLSKGHSMGDLHGLTVHPTRPEFISAGDDRDVIRWNLEPPYDVLASTSCSSACRTVAYSADGKLLAVGLKDGEVLVLDARKLTVFAAARDRRGPVNVVKFSPDSKYLAAGAETECVDFYDVTNLKKGMPRVGSHVGEKESGGISTLDWSVKSLCIQADTTDFRHMVIEVPSGKIEPEKQPGQEGFESHVWSSWTSVLGSEVRGIWPKDANKADINCCDLAHSGTALATGDDWGHVKLFPFPCPDPETTPFGKYPGHSAHVTNVKFSFDDRQIVSAGGKDNCLFVWHTEPGEDS